MNEKIKELAIKAGFDGDLMELNHSIGNPSIAEKFAELILKECCTIIREEENDALNTFRYMGDSPPGRDYMSKIKKHFGVI